MQTRRLWRRAAALTGGVVVGCGGGSFGVSRGGRLGRGGVGRSLGFVLVGKGAEQHADEEVEDEVAADEDNGDEVDGDARAEGLRGGVGRVAVRRWSL